MTGRLRRADLGRTTPAPQAGLAAEPTLGLGAQDVASSADPGRAARAYLSKERSRNPTLTSLKGVPIVVAIVVVLLVVLTFLLNRTAWGRHVYAVGGNAEAARRAGINVAGSRCSAS